MSNVIWAIEQDVSQSHQRRKVYRRLIRVFEEEDCDTLDECLGQDRAFDMAYYDEYPDSREVS